MYRSGKVRKRRNVKEKPTIRRKLGFDYGFPRASSAGRVSKVSCVRVVP